MGDKRQGFFEQCMLFRGDKEDKRAGLFVWVAITVITTFGYLLIKHLTN